jgi:hypothetical protein
MYGSGKVREQIWDSSTVGGGPVTGDSKRHVASVFWLALNSVTITLMKISENRACPSEAREGLFRKPQTIPAGKKNSVEDLSDPSRRTLLKIFLRSLKRGGRRRVTHPGMQRGHAPGDAARSRTRGCSEVTHPGMQRGHAPVYWLPDHEDKAASSPTYRPRL